MGEWFGFPTRRLGTLARLILISGRSAQATVRTGGYRLAVSRVAAFPHAVQRDRISNWSG